MRTLLAASLLLSSGCVARPNTDSSASELSETCGAANTEPVHYVQHMEQGVTIPQAVTLTRDSVVVYYAIDTREAFMQAAVDEDLRALRAACELTTDQAKKQR